MDEQKVLIVDDLDDKKLLRKAIEEVEMNASPSDKREGQFLETAEELSAKGLVRLSGGRIIKRENVVYKLAPNSVDPRVLHALDGTSYTRDAHGTLRRDQPKVSAKKRYRTEKI